MKYSYIVLAVLIFYQFLSSLATDEHLKIDDHLDDFKKASLIRHRRQLFGSGKFFGF